MYIYVLGLNNNSSSIIQTIFIKKRLECLEIILVVKIILLKINSLTIVEIILLF
jgi:hypothetical protein